MLTLILGPSGSGKSVRLREELRQRARSRQRSILIVPEQFTSSTEGALYHALGDELSAYVESYSFTSLAETLLRRYGGAAVPTLSEAGRAVLVRRAMDEMMDKVVYYSRQRRSAAFCQKAAETISELKSAGIRPETLADYANAPGADKDKLGELALIFGTYETLLAQTAMDPGDRVELAAKSLDQAFFAGRTVYIDEFDTFNHSKRAMLAAMLPVADVTVSLCCDQAPDQADDGVFSGARRVANTLKSMAASAGVPCKEIRLTQDMRHKDAPVLAELGLLLADPTYTPEAEVDPAAPAITYYKADSRQAEAKAVAAAVKARARAGVPYNKMAVICRESEAYLAPLRYEFRLAGIPFFFDEPTTAEHAAPIRLVRALLDLVRRGLSSERLLAVAKTGLTKLPEEQLCALENYAYTWQLSAAQWREPFTLSPAGFGAELRPEDARQLELAEEARAWLVPILDRYAKAGREKPAEALCALTYRTMQALGGEEQAGAAAERLKQAEGIPAAEEAIRVWNLASELLDQMALLLGEETLPAAECGELFELLARTTDLGHIPQSLDAVILTTAGRMRLDNPEFCFVLGLAEGEFPKAPGESGLLTHTERDSLIRQGVDMPDCFENRMVREQVCFYKALTAPSKGLWLSWAAGPGALPVTSALAPVVELLAPGRPDLSIADLTGTPAAALDVLGQTWDPESPATAALYGAVEAAPGGAEQLAPVRRAASAEPYKVRDKAAMRRLLGRDLWLSPSKMERYYSCPFSYFMEYVLNARPRRQAALTADQSGNLVHYVLEQALARAGEGFVDLTEDELARLAAEVAEEYVKENMPGGAARFGYLVRRLERSAASLLCYIQAEQRQGSFVPVAFELGIGGKEGEVPPVTLTTAGGETVRMVGKIDRVDAYKEGGKTWLRVVDYKTGSKEFLLEDVRNGLNCQMLIYLFTLTRNGNVRFENPAPAGVLYLMADPAPARESREKAAKGLEYQVEGMVVQDEAVLRAMDRDATGLYVPLKFDKAGHPKLTEALASLSGLAELQNEMDSLVLRMAQNLYEGEIAVEPLARGKRGETHCEWCDYRSVCRRQDD